MKKFLTFILVLVAVLSVSSVAMAGSSTTCPGDSTCGHQATIGSTHFDTLGEAVAAVQDGDTLIIKAGTYNTDLSIKKSNVTVKGEGEVVINGKGSFTGANFTVDNIDFINSGTAFYIWGYGTVKNCKISGSNGLYQSYLTTGQTANFINCEIYGGTYGIHFDSTTDDNYGGSIIIDGCTFAGWNSFGDKITNITISNSTFNHNGTYGQLRFYQNATVTNCTFDPKMSIDGNLSSEETVVINNSSTKDGSSLADRVSADLGEDFQVNGALVVKDQATLTAALQDSTVTSIILAKNITITGDWDCTSVTLGREVVIDGNGHTIKVTGRINDRNNYHAFLRTEAPVTVKNLTIDMSEATSLNETRMRAISTNANLTVDGCTFIGNPAYTNTRAIIFGEGAGTNVGNLEIKITNSTFKDWRYGIRDNENGQDVKSVEISSNEFDNAGVNVCAKESITFTNNTLDNSAALLHSYTNRVAGSTEKGKPDSLTVTGNTLDGKTANTVDENGNLVEDPAPSQSPEINPTTSSGNGISVTYNGGNSFSTSKSDVPTGVEIDGVPVTFNGTGSNFTVGCISSDAKWVTVRWNSTSVTTNFTPDGLVECTTVSIPKTGDMSIWAAVAAFFGF